MCKAARSVKLWNSQFAGDEVLPCPSPSSGKSSLCWQAKALEVEGGKFGYHTIAQTIHCYNLKEQNIKGCPAFMIVKQYSTEK
eukprot:13049040-Ditylum_brightwellii.AAC.1